MIENDELEQMWENGDFDDAYGVRPAFSEVAEANQELAEANQELAEANQELAENQRAQVAARLRASVSGALKWPLDYSYPEAVEGEDWPLSYEYDEIGKPVSY